MATDFSVGHHYLQQFLCLASHLSYLEFSALFARQSAHKIKPNTIDFYFIRYMDGVHHLYGLCLHLQQRNTNFFRTNGIRVLHRRLASSIVRIF